MTYANPDALVSTDWLADHLSDPGVAVVDASWHLPTVGRDGRAEYAEKHIPGAVYFDIDEIKDADNPLPHMVPSAEVFAQHISKLGIRNDQKIVCYDCNGGPGASMRAWWMFRLFGHNNAAVLNGGSKKWEAEGKPMEGGIPTPAATDFKATFRPGYLRTLDQVRNNLTSHSEIVIDARSAGRFDGTDPEFRPGIRSGHIPGSVSFPFHQLLNADDNNTMKSADELAAAFAAAGIDGNKPVISSCGSGVSAAVAFLALHLIGNDKAAIYDGSWTEWGGHPDTPVDS